jgi:hypothetical protein
MRFRYRPGFRGLTINAALFLAGHNRRHFPFGLIVCPFDQFIAFLEERNAQFGAIAPNDPAFSDELFGNDHKR